MVDSVTLANAHRAFSDTIKLNNEGSTSSDSITLPNYPSKNSGSFIDLVKENVASAIKTGKDSEAKSTSVLLGKTDLPELVVAIQEAELTLQTVVNIRNKMVQAYQEIIKMPV